MTTEKVHEILEEYRKSIERENPSRITVDIVHTILDRIEATWKRERDDLILLADAAQKMLDHEREEFNRRVEDALSVGGMVEASRHTPVGNSALSAPPRNCDFYDSKESAQEAYKEYHLKYISAASNKFDFPMKFEDWLFTTANEGGETDGSK